MRWRMGAGLAMVVLITGCAPTKYQADGGWSGGFSEVQLDRDVFRITFNGNSYTRPQQAGDYALLRGAEVTLQNGFTHFTVVEERSHADVQTLVTPVETTTKSERKASGEVITRSTSTGGYAITDVYPTAVNTIRCYTKRPDHATGLVYDARFLCGSLGKKYGVTCSPPVAAK